VLWFDLVILASVGLLRKLDDAWVGTDLLDHGTVAGVMYKVAW
jgi:hypothetical protein